MCMSSPAAPAAYVQPPTPKPVDPMVSPEQATAGVGDVSGQTGADNVRKTLRIDLAKAGDTATGLAIPS
jgi:hypothetical protein